MEAPRKNLHPLLMAAAISVTVFSAVGVAAITGLIPTSKGSVKEDAPAAAVAAPAPAQPEISPKAEAAPAREPVKKHVAKVHKPVKHHVAYAETPALAPLAQKPVVETEKPVVKPGLLGTVESVREVEDPGQAQGIGAVGGGIAGAVIGHNIGDHNKLVTLLGAAGGALLGNHIEKQARATKHWELDVRLDNGTTQTIRSDTQPFWHQGDRVRLLHGELQPV